MLANLQTQMLWNKRRNVSLCVSGFIQVNPRILTVVWEQMLWFQTPGLVRSSHTDHSWTRQRVPIAILSESGAMIHQVTCKAKP